MGCEVVIAATEGTLDLDHRGKELLLSALPYPDELSQQKTAAGQDIRKTRRYGVNV